MSDNKHNDLLGYPITVGDFVVVVGDPNQEAWFSTVTKLNPVTVGVKRRNWGGTYKFNHSIRPTRLIVLHDDILEHIMLQKLQGTLKNDHS